MVPKTPFSLLLLLLELFCYSKEFCILNISEEKNYKIQIMCKFICQI